MDHEEYLKHELKTDKPVADDKALKDIKFNKVNIDHTALNNTLAKLVCIVPMPEKSREVLLYKLANPGITNMQIALTNGLRITDIIMFEEEGKARMKRYMDRYSEQDMVSKANANETILNEVRNINAKKIVGGTNKLE